MNPIPAFAASARGVELQRALNASVGAIIDEAIAIQQIPAPTFAERPRADYAQSQFEACGLSDITQDALYNVYGRLPGRDSTLPALCVAAHTDTVFAAHTDLQIQRGEGRIVGPGIGDNSLGVAALLGAMRLLAKVPRAADVWFVANTREEGLGDLGGIRAAVTALRPRLGACVILEGMAYGQVYTAGICVRRLRISAHTAGGHSWLHYGQPSAVHALVRFAARMTDLTPPASPRTTYNIGLIEGGQSVNSIATDASLTLDMRSEAAAPLAALEADVRKLLDAAAAPGVEFRVEVVGDRPAGSIPTTHPLARAAAEALEATKTAPAFHSGSTDANYPLSVGLPAVTIGITTGGNAHRLDEFIDLQPIPRGMWQLLLLALSVSGSL